MTTNTQLVESLYADFGRGELEAILASLTSDIDWQDYGRASDFPALGPRHGHAEVRAFFGLLATELDFLEFTPLELHGVGDKVFVQGHSLLAMKKNGRRVDMDWVHIFAFRDGKVRSFREFSDTAQIAEAYRTAA